MKCEKRPFFNLDNIVFSKKIQSNCFSFYNIKLNKIDILIGQTEKIVEVNKVKYIIDNLLNKKTIWNDIEREEFNNFIKNNQYSRLYEKLLTIMLIKFGTQFLNKRKKNNIDLSLNQISLLHNHLDKPEIKIILNKEIDKQNIYYNISITHTKKNVYVAFCSKVVGIDGELIKKRSKSWEKKFFSEDEYIYFLNYFNSKLGYSTDTLYIIMWAIKESTIKIKRNKSLDYISDVQIRIDDDIILSKLKNDNIEYQNYISLYNDSVLNITLPYINQG